MNSKKQEITEKIKQLAKEQNFTWLDKEYKKPKDYLYFKHNTKDIVAKINWSNLKQRGKIPLRNNKKYHNNKLLQFCNENNMTLIDNYINYVTKIKYKCNICNTIYNRRPVDFYKCGVCNNFYKNNKGITTKHVLKNPYKLYYLYLVKVLDYNCIKIGMYSKEYIRSRFSSKINIILIVSLPMYKAYFLEQFIIFSFSKHNYTGDKFPGYTEAFNTSVPINKIKECMGASIKDVEPCELLETLEADNQQLSLNSNVFESSTTRTESL